MFDWGTAIQAGGSILGGMMGSDAAGDAANAQREAVSRAQQIQQQQYEQARLDAAPYRDAGALASKRLRYLLGLGGDRSIGDRISSADAATPEYQSIVAKMLPNYTGMDDPQLAAAATEAFNRQKMDKEMAAAQSDPTFGQLTRKFTQADLTADPVYQNGLQFGLEQGTRGINERAIANGGYDSGATLKALTRFGNDYGSTKANESYGRFTGDQSRTYGMLSGQQGMGLNAVNGTMAAGQNFANQSSDLATQAGNANAAGIVGGANSMAQGFGGVGTAIQGYQNNKVLEALLKSRNGGVGVGGTIYGAGGSFNPDN